MSRCSVVAIVSGGVDSVTLAYLLAAQGCELHLLSFDYGQRHVRELDCATRCAKAVMARQDVIDLRSLGVLLLGSALTDCNVPVPDGCYDEDSMARTVVPNRNAVLLAAAFAVAASEGASAVAIGVHEGDHPLYLDCRPDFIDAMVQMERNSLGEGAPTLLAPFLHKRKFEVVQIGATLGVPFEHTWSCYNGGEVHCGCCGTCVERREAFNLAGVDDPTVYDPYKYQETLRKLEE